MKKLKSYVETLKKEDALKNFELWFNENGIRDENEDPKVLYSGTLSNFEHFDISKTQPEAYWGQGFYFSDNPNDASYNYATPNGPDHLIVKEQVLEYIQSNLESILKENYQEEINNQNNEPINADLAKILELIENDEDIDEDLQERVTQHIMSKSLKRDHEGFVYPVFAAPRKIIDTDNHIFYEVEDYSTLNDYLSFLEDFDIYSEIKCNIECIPTALDEICEISLDDMMGYIDEAADSYSLDEDEIEKIKHFTTEYFSKHDDVIEFTFSLRGELYELKEHLKDILKENDYYSESNMIDEAFNSFDEKYDGVSISKILEKEDLWINLADCYIKTDNDYFQMTSGIKAILAMAFRRMGYDAIQMNPDGKFNMKHVAGATHYIFFNSNIIKSSIGNNGEYSLQNPSILHRVSEKITSNNSVSLSMANHIVNDLAKHYKGMPKCIVHSDILSIPESLFRVNPDLKTCSGWFDDLKKTAHIYLPNIIDKKDLQKTLCHEIFGHMSLREILDDKYENTMLKVYNYYDKKGEMGDIRDKYVSRYKLDITKNKDKALLGEEKMAQIIEEHGFNQFPLKNVIVGAIKSSLRKVIPQLKFNETDIKYLVYKCHENMMNQHSHKKRNKINHKH